MSPEEFRQLGHRMIDWIADYRSTLESRPILPAVEPGELKAKLPSAPPEEPEGFDAIFTDLDSILLPGVFHWQHPRFFGYFPSNGSLSSVLGDFLSTGLGTLGLSWQSSPALTELEEVVTDWLRGMLGLSADWQGVIQDTASTCTLVALLCARERASNFSLARGGLQGHEPPLTVYVSTHSHSSVLKAALLAGFGQEFVRQIPVDANFALDANALAEAVREDRAAGRVPAAVVATIGTTTTTAIDPLAAITALKRDHSLWVHVDAAMGGSAMILPECRSLWSGIEEADSLVINAHKWLGAAFDCSLYYVRDPDHLVRVMSTNPSYLRSSVDGRVKNYRDWGIPLGRRFRALKLWCLLRSEGVRGLQRRLRRDLANAHWFAEQVRQTPRWRLLAPIPLQTVCVRHEPTGLSGAELDRHTLKWVDQLNRSGHAYLTTARLDERWIVRVSIGAELTEQRHVADLWQRMRQHAEACAD